jgi:hypothetical protein
LEAEAPVDSLQCVGSSRLKADSRSSFPDSPAFLRSSFPDSPAFLRNSFPDSPDFLRSSFPGSPDFPVFRRARPDLPDPHGEPLLRSSLRPRPEDFSDSEIGAETVGRSGSQTCKEISSGDSNPEKGIQKKDQQKRPVFTRIFFSACSGDVYSCGKQHTRVAHAS